jgi:hypothetical protein
VKRASPSGTSGSAISKKTLIQLVGRDVKADTSDDAPHKLHSQAGPEKNPDPEDGTSKVEVPKYP